jgi:adenine/guanine phosphoribosyltransferase-like PRPP-binding protein
LGDVSPPQWFLTDEGRKNLKTIDLKPGETSLELLARCGGYYECPRGPDGKRVGPLVGYAGRDLRGRQYVGDVYANFAKAERHAPVLRFFGGRLHTLLTGTTNDLRELWGRSTGFCGAPEGGKALAEKLADLSNNQYIYPEKKVTVAATPDSREVAELVFDRHEPDKRDSWWIVEDVCNNFSTTGKLVTLIESFGASVCGIICFLNRSLEIEKEFSPRPDLVLPVIALVRKPIPQYSQDDPAVKHDLDLGNIVWKPKNDWSKLADAMAQAKGTKP